MPLTLMAMLLTLMALNNSALAASEITGLNESINTQANSQTSDNVSGYQVELFIFTQGSEANGELEMWPTNLKLAYPRNIVALKNPADASLAPVDYIYSDDAQNPQTTSTTSATSTTTSTTSSTTSSTNTNVDPAHPFELLSPKGLKLNIAQRNLERAISAQPLFHKAWRQSTRQSTMSGEDAPAILIQGGEMYNDHYELEGYIKVSYDRQFNFESDLWFSQYEANTNNPASEWSSLPARPVIASEITPPTDANGEVVAAPKILQNFEKLEQAGDAATTKSFAIKRIVQLREQRRIHVSELHYFDHPLVGILIQISPYQAPPEKSSQGSPPK